MQRELSSIDYRTLFQHASDGLLVHPTGSDEILEVNDQFAEMLGYTREELHMRTISDITADEWTPSRSASERIQEAREQGNVTFEWKDQRKDGTTFWAEVNLTLVTLSGVERVLASIRNIDERKRHERRAKAIFDQTYQFTGLMEPDGTVVEANQTALDFGDLDREDVIGKPVWECYWFMYSEEIRHQVKQAVQRASSGEFVRQNLEVRGSDGIEIIDFSIRPITDNNEDVRLLIPEGRLISERVQYKERLDVYNRVLRHNIRNQLTTINVFTNQIAQTTDDPRITDLTDRVLTAGSRLQRITEQVREFDRIRNADRKAECIEIESFLSDIASESVSNADTTTVWTDVEDGLILKSNKQLVGLIIRQLCENAVEHGGTTVRVSAVSWDKKDGIEVRVADDGMGIPQAEYEPILNGTSTSLEHASGIGLLIIKWGIDKLDGELEFESEEGESTAVVVRFPNIL